MGTLIIDLDGTCLEFHTNNWLPGVVDKLTQLSQAGHQIVFITMRGDRDADQIWNGPDTERLLEKLPFEWSLILNSTWPRVLIDDHPPQVLHTVINSADWVGRFT